MLPMGVLELGVIVNMLDVMLTVAAVTFIPGVHAMIAARGGVEADALYPVTLGAMSGKPPSRERGGTSIVGE
jgi:hypothetical protein